MLTPEIVATLKATHGRLFRVVLDDDREVLFRGPTNDEYQLMLAANTNPETKQSVSDTILGRMIVFPDGAERAALPPGIVNNEDYGAWFAKVIGHKAKKSGEL